MKIIKWLLFIGLIVWLGFLIYESTLPYPEKSSNKVNNAIQEHQTIPHPDLTDWNGKG